MFFGNITLGDDDDAHAGSYGGGGNNNNNGNWYNVFNTTASIFSQWLASRGRYQTVQLSNGQVVPVYPQQNQTNGGGIIGQTNLPLQSNSNLPIGSTLGGGVDGIIQWFANNPFVLMGGALGLYLLFRDPPRRR